MKRRSAPFLAPLLLALAALAASPAALAQAAWKWKDAGGKVQFSDLPPPPSVPDKDILARPATAPLIVRPIAAAASAAPAAPAAPNAKFEGAPPRVDPEIEARRRKATADQEVQKKQQEEKDAALRAENCQRARGHLRALEDGQRIVRTNAAGDREVLDDRGRAEEMQRARTTIASSCR